MINELPTILEVVSKATEENKISSGSSTVTEAAPEASNETKVPEALPLTPKEETKKEEEAEVKMQEGSKACRVCEEIVGTGVDFGILCATCKYLYHGKCVNITPFDAMFITCYECPQCSNKRTAASHGITKVKKEEDVKDMGICEGAKEEKGSEVKMREGSDHCRVCGEITGMTGVDFGIICATCNYLYHGKCVNITPFDSMFITRYECPQCSNKRTAASNEITKVKKEEDVKDMGIISKGAKEEKESDGCRVCGEIGGVTGVNFGVFCTTCKRLVPWEMRQDHPFRCHVHQGL